MMNLTNYQGSPLAFYMDYFGRLWIQYFCAMKMFKLDPTEYTDNIFKAFEISPINMTVLVDCHDGVHRPIMYINMTFVVKLAMYSNAKGSSKFIEFLAKLQDNNRPKKKHLPYPAINKLYTTVDIPHFSFLINNCTRLINHFKKAGHDNDAQMVEVNRNEMVRELGNFIDGLRDVPDIHEKAQKYVDLFYTKSKDTKCVYVCKCPRYAHL